MAQALTVKQAAARLHVTPETVRRYLRRGMIPADKLGGSWRIMETELEQFASSLGRIPAGKRVSALGIASDIEGLSSEDFMRRKQDEIEWENRRFREDAT